MVRQKKGQETFKPFKGRAYVYASGSAIVGDIGTANPASDHHKFDTGAGEFHTNAITNTAFGDQLVPALDIEVPGFGTLALTPNEVHRLLMALEAVSKRARHPKAYGGSAKACTEEI